jgi:hypothetical protein
LLHQQNFQYHQDKIIIMSGILDFFADNKEVTQLIAKSVPAIMGMHQASKAKNAAEGYQIKLDNIETNRQEIVNPYANVTNPFANMQVATQAAEMQAEQTDIALANTLDTLRSTGAAAGGATALAQAALKSKQGISADIEKQEMANQKLMAQGEQQMQQLQGAGKGIQMNMQENRDLRDITRLQDNMNLAQQQRASGQATAAMAMASGIAGMAGLIDPEAKNVDDAAATTSAETSDFSNNGGFTEAQKLSMQGRSLDEKLSSYDPTAGMDIFNENIYDPTAYSMTQDFFIPKDFSQSKNSWYRTGLNNMVAERERLVQAGESTEAIQSLIDDTRKKYKI